MWILPRQLVSACAADTLDLNSDCEELSLLCERSATWRSSFSQWRTWSQRWKRVSWMQRLSGRILRPSRQSDFEARWISSLAAIRANPSVSPASGTENPILDTFGRILRQSCGQLNLFGASSRTSPDTLPLDSPQFIEAYARWVTHLRRDCLRRQRSARRTSASGCSSWPTARAEDGESCGGHNAREAADSLRAAVTWPTPQASEYKGQSQRGQHCPEDRLTNMVVATDGPQAPDSPSTSGKSQELWQTPHAAVGGHISRGGDRKNEPYLPGQVKQYAKGRLNPLWVSQLMGVPVGWCDPEWTNSDCSATASCRHRQKEPSENS